MLQDVEIRPGQAEEEEKARNKVVLLDGSKDNNEAIDNKPNMERAGDLVQEMKETVEGSEAMGEDKINVV